MEIQQLSEAVKRSMYRVIAMIAIFETVFNFGTETAKTVFLFILFDK